MCSSTLGLYTYITYFYTLPDHKILVLTITKECAGNIFSEEHMVQFLQQFDIRKHSENSRKCWLPAFSPFPLTQMINFAFERVSGIVRTEQNAGY